MNRLRGVLEPAQDVGSMNLEAMAFQQGYGLSGTVDLDSFPERIKDLLTGGFDADEDAFCPCLHHLFHHLFISKEEIDSRQTPPPEVDLPFNDSSGDRDHPLR